MIFAGMKAKFYVIKRFEKALDLGEVEFVKMSGRHKYLPWIICVLFIGLGLLSQIE